MAPTEKVLFENLVCFACNQPLYESGLTLFTDEVGDKCAYPVAKLPTDDVVTSLSPPGVICDHCAETYLRVASIWGKGLEIAQATWPRKAWKIDRFGLYAMDYEESEPLPTME